MSLFKKHNRKAETIFNSGRKDIVPYDAGSDNEQKNPSTFLGQKVQDLKTPIKKFFGSGVGEETDPNTFLKQNVD